MKSQKNTIESDWEGGKPFLSRTKNEEVSIDENYYVGREHLFDPKAKKPNSSSFFADKKKSLVLWAVSIFSVVSFFYDGGIGGAAGISTFIFVVLMIAMKIGDLGDSKKTNFNEYDGTIVNSRNNLAARTLSINTADKLFTKE